MKERPILFSAPMVRAILGGSKTMTRRVVKPQLDLGFDLDWQPMSPLNGKTRFRRVGADYPDTEKDDGITCPYGQPGDRLWVREAFGYEFDSPLGTNAPPDRVIYRADPKHAGKVGWSPSIHMSRAASRMTLEVTGVRVERLQDISAADADAEGLRKFPFEESFAWAWRDDDKCGHASPTGAFRNLWESINGADSWDANPWVWVVEFKRVTP